MKTLLRATGTLLLLGWLAWRTDWPRLRDALVGLHLGLALSAVVVYALTQVISGVRWRLLARPLGFDRPLSAYVHHYYVGMFFNLFLPTSVGGDVVRGWLLDASSGRKVAALLSVFVDRLSGLLVLLLLACAAVLYCPPGLPSWLPVVVWSLAASAVAGLAVLPLVARWLPLPGKLARLAADLPTALALALRPGPLLLSGVVQVANVVLVVLLGRALGLDVPAAYYGVLVPLVTLLTLAPISLNGMGVREGGVVLFLAPLGVGAAPAVALALSWFAVFTACSAAGGVWYLFGGPRRFEVRPDAEPVGDHSDQGRTRQPAAAA